jgi:cytochrome c-type biogenesis protein CcmH/NrfF
VVVFVGGALGGWIAWQNPDAAKLLVWLLPIALIVGVLFLALLRRAGREFSLDEADEQELAELPLED